MRLILKISVLPDFRPNRRFSAMALASASGSAFTSIAR
jgi:hypothetical protein